VRDAPSIFSAAYDTHLLANYHISKFRLSCAQPTDSSTNSEWYFGNGGGNGNYGGGEPKTAHMGGACRGSAGFGVPGGRASGSARQVTAFAGAQVPPRHRLAFARQLVNAAEDAAQPSSCETDATAGCASSLGHARLKLEDHWLRATLGEEKLWYGSAAGKPGVILGTWASQRQQQQGELRQLGDPVQAGPAARTHRPEAAPRPQLQQRQFLQEEAPADPQQEQPPCSDTCRDKYQLGACPHSLHSVSLVRV